MLSEYVDDTCDTKGLYTTLFVITLATPVYCG